MKTKILFICLGNICRSPMAEGIFRKIVEEANLSARFDIDSAGLINYHQGELPDKRMRTHALRRGYLLTHRSRPICAADFEKFDLIIGMDNQNMKALFSLCPSAQTHKLKLAASYCRQIQTNCVPDPYYGNDNDFEYVIDILEDACAGLLSTLTESHDQPKQS